MSTQFDSLAHGLSSRLRRLPKKGRALFLLAYAQRFAPAFRLFEELAGTRAVTFQQVLSRVWDVAEGADVPVELESQLDGLIPGEDWVVGGFHDAIAQYVGGLAAGALEGLSTLGLIEGEPEYSIFDLLRVFLSEMRLGCLEPGDNDAGKVFEEKLHREELIVSELAFADALLERLAFAAVTASQIREFVSTRIFDPSILEPELSLGLARDRSGV